MGWLLAASSRPCCTCSASALHGDAGRATCPVLTSIFWPGATAFSWGSSYMEMHAASLRNPLGFEPMIGRSRQWAILGLCCPGAAMHLHVAYCSLERTFWSMIISPWASQIALVQTPSTLRPTLHCRQRGPPVLKPSLVMAPVSWQG